MKSQPTMNLPWKRFAQEFTCSWILRGADEAIKKESDGALGVELR